MRVFISGIGVITPLGLSREVTWNNLLDGKSCVEKIPKHWYDYLDFRSGIWAPLPDINLKSLGFKPAEIIQNDIATLLAITTTAEALEHAGLKTELINKKRNQFELVGVNSERCSVIFGTGSGGASSLLSNFSYHSTSRLKKELAGLDIAEVNKILEKLHHPRTLNPFVIPMSICNSVPAAIGIKFSIHNDIKPIVQACSSGTTALGEAFYKIKTGQSDLVISGGLEHLNDHWGASYKGFDVSQTLAMIPEDNNINVANRPFDRDRSGFLFSQGGGATLILESEEHLEKRGGSAIAEIMSFSETFDAKSLMAPDPTGIQIERMINNAVASAGLSVNDIDYINAHGTGTISNDQVEADVIQRVFGKTIPINSTKSLIGHSLGGSGAIEAAVCALSLRDQILHPSLNLVNPIAELDFVKQKRVCKLTYAFSQSFAFGGHNSGLVFKKY